MSYIIPEMPDYYAALNGTTPDDLTAEEKVEMDRLKLITDEWLKLGWFRQLMHAALNTEFRVEVLRAIEGRKMIVITAYCRKLCDPEWRARKRWLGPIYCQWMGRTENYHCDRYAVEGMQFCVQHLTR